MNLTQNLLGFWEVINTEIGSGFSIIISKDSIRMYKLEKWGTKLVKEIK